MLAADRDVRVALDDHEEAGAVLALRRRPSRPRRSAAPSSGSAIRPSVLSSSAAKSADCAELARGSRAWRDHIRRGPRQGKPDARRISRPCRARPSCTQTSTSSSRGRRRSCPSGSGRSTSTGCTRTSASTSRNSSRSSSRRYAVEGDLVWDPFCGSGTTLVEANAFGARAAGCDVSAFNCLISRVKVAGYDPISLLGDVVRLSAPAEGEPRAASARPTSRSGSRRARSPSSPLSATRIAETTYPELWQVVLSRAARSARLARHDDLDFPREPVRGEYFCHKHRRVCRPVEEAEKFLRRYVRDAVQRVQEFADLRTDWPVGGHPRRLARRRAPRAGRPRDHVAAVSRADRLPRAARLRVRAARAAAGRRGRDRPGRAGATATRSPRCSSAPPRR